MATTKNYIHRIDSCLREGHPDSCYGTLQPGLTSNEIDELMDELDFSLPLEAYEFYAWKNGTEYGEEEFQGFFHGLSFLSLECAVGLYEDFREESLEHSQLDPTDEPWKQGWLPFLAEPDRLGTLYGCSYYCIVGNLDESFTATSRILYVSHRDGALSVAHESLTDWLCKVAEFYESGEYIDYI
ncbi:MAG: SMI1/KNR4 family protein [Cyanobacteria bacterium P01_G01_bin.54]